MSIIDKAPESGKFRATASVALGGTAGIWGVGNLINVTTNAGGELIAAGLGTADGVILTSEGRDTDLTADKLVVAGRQYTVFRQCELVEVATFTGITLSAGDLVYCAAAGDIDLTPAVGAIFVGWVLLGGERMVIDFNGKPVG